MNLKTWLFIGSVLLGSTIHQACKKEENQQITVKGTVTNLQSGSALSGAVVYLEGKLLNSGIYNNSFSVIASSTTNGSGQFEIKTDWQVVSQYRIRVYKLNHFETLSVVSAESIPKGSTYSTSFAISPIAWVRMNVRNAVGMADDEIQYKFSSTPQSCYDCCSNDYIVGTGATYTNSYKCKVIGDRDNTFYWTVKRNGITTPSSSSRYCPAFDTTVLNIVY